jgi:hypothetical protein
MSGWDFDPLWQKAKLFAERAADEEREGPLFPFWSILSLELLARAALAKTHPALLADPTDHNNILYAFGLGNVKNPKSVPAKALFSRCSELIPEFTQDDRNKCMVYMDLRNQEVHTGTVALETLPASWLADYYRITKILLTHIGKSLVDLFGPEETPAAEKMIGEATKEKMADVNERLKKAATYFDVLTDDEKDEARKASKRRARTILAGNYGKKVPCPICNAEAALIGEHVRSKEPQIEDDVIVQEIAVLPTEFECSSCRLKLEGHDAMQAAAKIRDAFAAFAGQFVVTERYSPEDYYDLRSPEEDDPSEYGEYNNE